VVPVIVYVRVIKHRAKPEIMQQRERPLHQTKPTGTSWKRGGSQEKSRDIQGGSSSYRWHSFLEKGQQWLENMLGEDCNREGQKLVMGLGARIRQSSLDHLQHGCRKEVKMEEDKDERHLCNQRVGLITSLLSSLHLAVFQK